MKKQLLFTLLSINLFAQNEIGCDTVVESEPVGCSISNVLNSAPAPVNYSTTEKEVVTQQKTMAITEKLESVSVMHDNSKLVIERMKMGREMSCPPFCVEPMNIAKVETVGELETLAFIDKLKEKKARLLIDVRTSKLYQKGTIPGAINLPLNILQDESKYQDEILKLLGAKPILKKKEHKWSFEKAQSLLIFDSSASTNEASSAIKKLLELGYPGSKLLYYRAGVEGWKSFGLTVI